MSKQITFLHLRRTEGQHAEAVSWRESCIVTHGELGQEHTINVALEQGGGTPPPVWGYHHEVLAPPNQLLLRDAVGFERLRTVITVA